MVKIECAVEGCGSRVMARGWCRKHYDRWRRSGTTDLSKANEQMCFECGQRKAQYRGSEGPICQPCYRRRQTLERRPPIPFVCANCGVAFVSRFNKSDRTRYCSRKCKGAARVQDGRAAESGRKHHYRKEYGLTLDEVATLRAGGCAICGTAQGEGRWGNLHIDHDHKTGVVRGALCNDCNHGIAKFKDDPDLLRKAAAYLER